MRLDQFLKWSRVIPRRSMAKAACDANRVRVNGLAARPARTVKPGDVVLLDLPRQVMRFRVAAVPDRAPGKAEAGALTEILENRRKDLDA